MWHMRQTRPLSTRVIAAFLAVITAFSCVPTQALAEAAAAVEPEAEQQVDATDAADDAAAGDTVAGDDAATANASSADGEKDADAEGAAEADDAEESSDAADAPAEQLGDEAVSAVAETSLSSYARVYVQKQKDQNSSYATAEGVYHAGDKLYANMYDGTSNWSVKSVANSGDWTYTWFAGSSKTNNVSDYTEVVGTEQELTVAEAMAGKYLICKVTAGGKDYYGPATTYNTGLNANYIPGPVLAAGQAKLYKVTLDKKSPSVGDTLTATAYTDSSTVAGDDINVTYTWSYADKFSGDYTVIEGETGNTLKLTDAYKNKYVKVEATAGVNTESAKTSDAVLAEGAVKLAGVELEAPSTEFGATLTAKAYTGSSSSPTYVDNSKVTYTWKKYKGSSAPSYSTTWETIEGASGPTFTVTDDLEGCYVSVSANAGANDVTLSYSDGYGVGPFKQAGAVDISAVSIVNTKDDTAVFTVGDTAKARVREKGAATGVYVDAEKLNFQWRAADKKSGEYKDIAGATSETLELGSNLEGKYIKCYVTSEIGTSDGENRTGYLVAPAGSINVTKVSLSKTGKVNVGDKLTATAAAASGDVTSDEHVVWSWYYGDSSSSCDTKIDGATGNTLEVTDAYLGKYVQARANGGYSEVKASAGPVVEPGAVELHHVEVTGSAKVDATLTAKAYVSSSTTVSGSDVVHYQWQYADTKTTSDAAFKDIPGAADSATYTVTDAMLGKYIRVKATSDGSVVSTSKPGYYGGTTKVDPLGPVTLAGQYTLSAVEIKDASTTILQSGRTVTPQAKVKDGYYTEDAPSDAKLTYTWYAKGENDSDWQQITEGVAADGTLTLTDALIGKSLKVTASALYKPVEWTSGTTVTATGEYNLLRVITNPQSNNSNAKLVAGDAVTAEAQSRRADNNTTNGIKVSDGVSFSWYVSDEKDGEYELLADVEGDKISVPDAAAGKYLKVVATSGSSSVETVFENKVVARDSLDAVVLKLSDKSVRPTPVYGKDTNINDVLEAKISELGFEGVTAKVKSVSFAGTNDKATVGISTDDETNGTITYFYMDPNDYSGFDFDGLRRATVTFELSKNGETAKYTPGSVTLPWNEDMLQQRLDNVASELAITYAAGDSADSVTGNVTLPYKAGSNKKFDVTWSSSSDQVKVSGSGWGDYTGKVTRTGSDRDVTLTATVKLLPNAGGSDTDVEGTAAHVLTVKGDLQKVTEDKAKLQALLDANFTYENVKYSGTDDVANKDGLTDDLQMPTTRTLGVDGKYYKVEYSASTDAITFNGYRGTVYQPQPGELAAATKITLTVTDKFNREVTATKTLDYAVAPQNEADLDAALALMEQAKAGYAAAILNGQDAKSVTGNMHAFQKAYLDANGKLSWSYDRATTDATAAGIVPVDLPGYDSMSGQDWRLFKSSNSAIVSAENLLVTQPEYNTKVTISSRLSSEKYARYAERYPNDERYAKLANQDVSATVTVLGTSGIDDPEVSATCSVIGIDADGNQQTWAAAQSFTLDNGATAADLSEKLFSAAGLVADYDPDGSWGWALNSITSPFDTGRTLGYDAATGRFWQLFINGEAASVGAGNYTLEEGDSVVWAYSKWGDVAPADQLSVSCEVIGQDADGNQQVWAQPVSLQVEEGTTAAQLSEQLFAQAGITANTGTSSWGWYLNSITSPFDANNVLSSQQVGENTWAFWQFFVNGELASVGAGNYALKAGDKVSWVYGSDGSMPGHVSASIELIGQDADGNTQRWTSSRSFSMVEGSTVADLSEELFKEAGINAVFSTSTWGWSLDSVSSPLDSSVTLAMKQTGPTSWAYWQLFINGEPASSMADGCVLKAGDKVSWAYTDGSSLPNPDEVVVDPSAPRPDWDAEWPGYADGGSGSATTDAATPRGDAKVAWTFDYKKYVGDDYANASEPLMAGGFIYLAVNNRLLKIDAQTGEVLKSSNLASSVSYTSRPVYAKGLVIVALGGGRVQALTADELITVWATDAVSDLAQASCTLTVDGNYVNVGTSDVPSMSTFNNGFFIRVNVLTGAVAWAHNEANEGYYWGGAASCGNYLVVSTSAGTVQVLSKSTGDVVSSVSLGAIVNSDCVASSDGSMIYVMSRDGKLNVLSLGDYGQLSFVRTVDLGLTGCGCTPTIIDGKLVVGGEKDAAAALAIVDLSSMTAQLVTDADGSAMPAGIGGIKSAPLVSAQGDATYVYFTVNAADSPDYVNYTKGGGVYRYKFGDSQATLIYDAAGHYQYCDSPVICDKAGNLYYINDSGTLFKLVSDGDERDPLVPAPTPEPVPEPTTPSDDNTKTDPAGSSKGDNKTTIALKSNTSDGTDAQGSEGEKLDEATPAEGTLETATKSDSVAVTSAGVDTGAEQTASQMPIWPFVGIGLGVLALILILLLGRRKKEDEE